MGPEFQKYNYNSHKFDWEKSDVYSMGITFLEFSTLMDSSEIKTEIIRNNLNSLIKKIKSEYLKEIIPLMIMRNPWERISIEELHNRSTLGS